MAVNSFTNTKETPLDLDSMALMRQEADQPDIRINALLALEWYIGTYCCDGKHDMCCSAAWDCRIVWSATHCDARQCNPNRKKINKLAHATLWRCMTFLTSLFHITCLMTFGKPREDEIAHHKSPERRRSKTPWSVLATLDWHRQVSIAPLDETFLVFQILKAARHETIRRATH